MTDLIIGNMRVLNKSGQNYLVLHEATGRHFKTERDATKQFRLYPCDPNGIATSPNSVAISRDVRECFSFDPSSEASRPDSAVPEPQTPEPNPATDRDTAALSPDPDAATDEYPTTLVAKGKKAKSKHDTDGIDGSTVGD